MRVFFSIVVAALLVAIAKAQVAPPQAFSYSAVARDAQGNPLVNQAVGLQFSILRGSTVGPIQYQENQFTTTNQFGIFTLIIGTGTVLQGSFNSINWGNDSYYLKVGLDANGGTNFQTMGTTQFLSVPYALYAESAGSSTYQVLSFSNDTLYLSNGGKVYLGNYNNTSIPQTLSVNKDTLKISQGNQVVLPSKFTVKINGVSISDPSINDVMVGPFTFLTENNYRYDLTIDNSGLLFNPILSDTMILASALSSTAANTLFSTSNSCSGSTWYAPADLYGGFGRGRVFNVPGSGIYYIADNAVPVPLSNPYIQVQVSGCTQISGTSNYYPVLPNNPTVTGFGFSSPKLKVTFSK